MMRRHEWRIKKGPESGSGPQIGRISSVDDAVGRQLRGDEGDGGIDLGLVIGQ